MPTQRCETCRFWLRHPHAQDYRHLAKVSPGHCRRFPPVLVDLEEDPTIGHVPEDHPYAWGFPTTFGDAWCGEWQAARPTEE